MLASLSFIEVLPAVLIQHLVAQGKQWRNLKVVGKEICEDILVSGDHPLVCLWGNM